MKIVGIGDLLISQQCIKEGFQDFRKRGCQVETVPWGIEDYEQLQNINLKVEKEGSEVYEPPEEILEAVRDADIVITQFCTITKRVLDACRNLKAIGVLRGGYENVNVPYATRKGVLVYHTPGRNSDAVADFTVGMMISECRNIAKGHCNLKEGRWVRDYTNADTVPDLPGRTVGIVGFGEIGRKVAKRLYGFDMEILTYDPYAGEVPDYVKSVSLEELAKVSTFVTLHARLCPETEHMIDDRILSMMRPDAYLINTARSGLVDEAALYEALKAKRIAGAALDVYEVEPPPKEYPLVTLENITLTPHMAGGTKDAFTGSPGRLAKEMIKALDGEISRCLINKEIFEAAVDAFCGIPRE